MKAAQLRKIKSFAEEHMTKLGLHGWPHVKRVLRLGTEISKIEKAQADLEIFEVAALLHDVAKHLEKENGALNHGNIGAEMAAGFLNSIGFTEEKIKSVCHAIRAHTHLEEPQSTEAKILHDSDFLDKMGAIGIATVFIKACLANTTIEEAAESWKRTSSESYVGKHILWLQKPHFYTETARSIASKRNKIVYAFFKQLEEETKLKDF